MCSRCRCEIQHQSNLQRPQKET
uniref:Uncharacterized protein n=1 Tax=Anguilla anguilla TaxID=7936 RepID=A0A0E9RS85_ANGAN